MPDQYVVEAGWPERTEAIRRAAARLCVTLGWSALHEMPLPNAQRADLLALDRDGCFACIEVKSGARDFLADAKWPDYRAFCDALFFAVDADFPQSLLPADAGLIVAHDGLADIVRDAPRHPLPPARRQGEQPGVAHRLADQHEADRRLSRAVAGQADGAAVEEIGRRRVA